MGLSSLNNHPKVSPRQPFYVQTNPRKSDHISTIQGKGIPTIKEAGPNLGSDSDGSDGWSYMLDTTTYDNGLHDISGLAFSELTTGAAPLGSATTQVIIKN